MIKLLISKKEETLQFETSIDEEKQKNISEYIMKQIGFDFTRGRLDKSVHPFVEDLQMMLELQLDIIMKIHFHL